MPSAVRVKSLIGQLQPSTDHRTGRLTFDCYGEADMLKISFAAIALFFLLQLPALSDKVFVWTDDKGVKHFSNTGPSESTEEFQQDKELPSESTSGNQSARNMTSSTQQSETNPDNEPTTDPAEPQSAETETDPDADYIETTRLDLIVFPITQDELVQREKSIVGDLQQQLDQSGADRQHLINREKKRLTLAIQDLEEAPLEKFGSQKNKRRQVGYYKYRLEKLIADPDEYIKYPESESD
ncbi:MAG: DUF4124 domain-containing protein [Desulfobacterales bacterium]|jgi:hypothetical protein